MYVRDEKKPFSVGLTGNIGSGKSAVAQRLAARGAAVIDADALAKDATRDAEVLARVAEAFGEQVLKDGQLDRQATAALVFDDPDARATLNSIIHPWVARARDIREQALRQAEPCPKVIVHDIPLLFETGQQADFDVVVVVTAPLEQRVARVRSRSQLSEQDIRARDAAQLPLADKVAHADVVIDNSGDLVALEAQVVTLWDTLTQGCLRVKA
jgi:dephospho-CoA kinase